MGYPDPEYVAKHVDQIAQKNEMDKSEVKVVDFACGTGLVGQYLEEKDFTNITGLDISPKMLELC